MFYRVLNTSLTFASLLQSSVHDLTVIFVPSVMKNIAQFPPIFQSPQGKTFPQVSDLLPNQNNFQNSPRPISRHVNSSLSVHLFLNSESHLGKSKKLNKGMKVFVLKTFKSYSFYCHKKTIIKHTGSARNTIQPQIQMCRGASIPYFKINALFLSTPSSGSTKW